MNYEPNTINWKVGDIVIHDADEKAERMLMRVLTLFENGRVGTEYLTREGTQPIYHNSKEVLHDPARFGIRTTTPPHTVPGDTRHSAVIESCPTNAYMPYRGIEDLAGDLR